MNLPVPAVGQDPGPDWATNVVACMSSIDSHTHGAGQGVAITPAGLDINSDLPINVNNIITIRSSRYSAQVTPLALSSDIGCVYVAGLDLYFNDVSGNQVRITQGGSVAGAAGTITGLPSGTASAAYAAGTFTFQSATSTPATMAVGPLVIGRSAASSKTVTLAPNSGQGSNYSMTFPSALPVATSIVIMTNTGDLSYAATTGSNAIVLATSPTITNPTVSTGTFTSPAITTPTITNPTVSTGTFTNPTVSTGTFTTPAFAGVPTGTITSGVYTPTRANVIGSTSTPGDFPYTRIGNRVTVYGNLSSTPSGGISNFTLTLPFAPTNNFASVSDVIGGASVVTTQLMTDSTVIAATGAKLAQVRLYTASATNFSNINLYFTYDCA